MPLKTGRSPSTVSSNISELHSGKTYAHTASRFGKTRADKQAVAIALNEARKAGGGGVNFPRVLAMGERQNLAQSGFMHGLTAGRADHVPVAVKANSYVVPADVVSAIGQGNSLAGAHALNAMFKMGPYGSAAPQVPHAVGKRFADGGAAPNTDIVISDGEFTVPPEKVAEIGNGDMNRGHDVLDGFVKHIRQKNIKTLRKLPGPKKS